MAHPPRIPVWLRADQEVVYFLTFCVARRERALANDEAFAAFESTIARLTNWNVIAAVLMPDHVHLLIAPNDRELPVGNASGAIKRWIRLELVATWQWQPGSFDRLLRSDESAEEKWQYIRENPVRAGLVEKCRIGPTGSALNCRAGAPPAIGRQSCAAGRALRRQAERPPYNRTTQRASTCKARGERCACPATRHGLVLGPCTVSDRALLPSP